MKKELGIRKQHVLSYGAQIAMLALTIGFMVTGQLVLADATDTMIEAIVKILCNIISVAGAVFALVGLVEYALAWMNDQSSDKQKALMKIVVAVVMTILPQVIKGISWADMITTY